MSTPRWVGNAAAVAQVDTLTIGGTIEVGDLFKATINGKTLSYPAGSTAAATEATAFAAAWNALSATLYPEFAEITAAATSGGALTLTADTPGKPFTVSVETTEANGDAADAQTFGRAATVANSGPKSWDTAANWDTGAVPVDGDDVRIDSGGDILYGLDQSAVEPATLTIAQSYTGKIGLPVTNRDNQSAPYPEYRDQYLKIGPVVMTIGEGPGSGSGRIKIDTTTDPHVTRILNTGQPESPANGAVILKGSESTNAIHVQRGFVDVAPFLGETADLAALTVGPDATVYLGAGVTLSDTEIIQSGGSLTINSATSGTATITLNDGTLTINSGGQVGLTVRGGTCIFNSTGTLGGNPRVEGNGHLDFSHDLRDKTVTNPIEVFGENARVSDPYRVVNPGGSFVLDLNGTEVTENLKLGRDVKISRAATS